jgi:hypothetical protein
MSIYAFTLLTHSYLRWLIVAVGLLLVVRTAMGWARSAHWLEADERLHSIFVALIDTQFTLGIVLYLFLSPISHAFFAQPGVGMKEPTLRFFGMEHAVAMLVAVAIVHIGRVRSKRATAPRVRQRLVCSSVLIALLLIAVSIPWPFLPYGRPLLRGVSNARYDAPAYDARFADNFRWQ